MSPESGLVANIFLAVFLFGLVFTVVSVVLGVSHLDVLGGHHVGGAGHHVQVDTGHGGAHAADGGHTGGGPDIRQADIHLGSHGADANIDGLPVLNMPTIMAFLTWFGGAGFIVTRTLGWGPAVAVPLALLSGITGGSIMFALLAKVLWPMRSTPLSSADFRLPGTSARVVSPIREGGVGEIVYRKAGSRFTAGARAVDNQPVARGTEVVIVSYERGLAYVQPVGAILNRDS